MRSDDKRVGAGVAVWWIDREAVFLVLQLAEEIEHALAADPRLRRIARAGEIGRRFLGAGEGEEAADAPPAGRPP